MAILVTCTCGKQFKVKTELAGKRGKCSACGRVLSIPTLAQSVDKEMPSPPLLRACPTCRKPLQPSAVICLNCGLDLRTGEQLPHAKSSTGVAPSKPPADAPTSSPRLWIALAAGGTCLVGVAAAVILLTWGGGAGSSESITEPELGPRSVSAAANSPSRPAEKKAEGLSKPTDPFATMQPDDSRGNTGPDQLVIRNLLAKVAAITPDDVTRYEKFLQDRSYLNSIAYQGALPYTGDDVGEIIKMGLENPAVSALTKLIQEKKTSTEKADSLICGQAIKALGYFGPSAEDAASQLAELQNHNDVAVGSAARLALKAIKTPPPGPVAQPADLGGNTGPDQLTVTKLLAKVAAITPDHIAQYEKFLNEPTGVNFLVLLATIGITADDVRDVVNMGLEQSAVSALITLIEEKKSSADKADILICLQSIIALWRFGPRATEATLLLTELQGYQDKAVGSAAKLALDATKTLPPAAVAQLPLAEASTPPVAMPFEQAFATGQIAWQPVKNVELTTKTDGGSKTQTTEFTIKFKYDESGNRSIDKTGWKTYTWPDQEATFGPGAIVRLTRDANVREGVLRLGEE